MKFGITIKPDISVERIVALTRQAEEAGFRVWLDFRLPRVVERTLSAADLDGECHTQTCGWARV